MTIREFFFNYDFTIDGEVIIKHYNVSDNSYDILGYKYYELTDDEQDYKISYIYANKDGLNIEVKYPNED